jgi:hypothetical protein
MADQLERIRSFTGHDDNLRMWAHLFISQTGRTWEMGSEVVVRWRVAEVVEFGCRIPSRFLRRVRFLNFPSMPFKPLN